MMVPVSSIEGIEVYKGAAQLPAEFGGSNSMCGVVAIWTKRGE
jgi:outer membrane receptor for ferrienterochelin and colicin